MLTNFLKTFVKENFYGKVTPLQEITFKSAYLHTKDYCLSHLKMSIELNRYVFLTKQTNKELFIAQYTSFYMLPFFAAYNTLEILGKLEGGKIFSSFIINEITKSILSELQVNNLATFVNALRCIKKFGKLSIYQSEKEASIYTIAFKENEDTSIWLKYGFRKTGNSVDLFQTFRHILRFIFHSNKGTDALFSFLYERIVDSVKDFFKDKEVSKIGTLRLQRSVEFLENPIYQVCEQLEVKSFGIQQRMLNLIQPEWNHGYYHEFFYWDTESQRIHQMANTVLSPKIGIPEGDFQNNTTNIVKRKSIKYQSSKRIIAFPGQLCRTLSACSFLNEYWAVSFADFLRDLENEGYEVLVKPKDPEELQFWNEFKTFVTPRGHFWKVIDENCACVVSSLFTSPSLEISVKTEIPSYYFVPHFLSEDKDLLLKCTEGYRSMQVQTAAQLIDKLVA